MTRTIALSERAYRRLKELKEALNLGYSELIELLIAEYEKRRIEELKTLCRKLRIKEEELAVIERLLKELRERKWW